MAVIVLKDAYVSINSVDLSDHVRKVTINHKAAEEDNTNMGATAKGRVAGLLDSQVTVEFAQDYAAGEVDATLFPLVGAAAFPIIIKPNGDTTSVTNPKYTGNAILTEYNPIDGQVGSLATTQITMPVDGVLSRATSDA